MTNKEVHNALADAKSPEWFKKVEVTISINHLDIQLTKEGYEAIHDYFTRQVRGWDKIRESIPDLTNSLNIFRQINSELESLAINSKNWDEGTLNQTLHQIRRKLDRFHEQKVFTYDAPETSFLIEVHKFHPNKYQGAFDYITKTLNNSRLQQVDYFEGSLIAYEFKNKGSEITKRRGKEKSSYTRLHNQLEQLFQDDKKQFKEHWESVQADKDELKKIYENDLNSKKANYEDWSTQASENQKKLVEEAKKQIEELEALYREKLKLEAPAKYWSDRAAQLRKEGNGWLKGLIGSAIVGVIALGIVLFLISDGTLAHLFNNSGSAIRWSIVFITFVSFLAYAIRTFAKLTFSSWHLVRDAEEREQLAYVYLALRKDQQIDDTERHLVMQSIFSRADSGLLKDDSSPTMPGNIIDKFMSKGQ